jgi:hypothetical protein
MKKTWLIPAACVAVAALLGACSMDKTDLRYRASSLREPLAVPQGLDGPQYSQAMDIPSAGSGAGTGAGTGAAAPGAQDIELPPDLRAGGPGQDQGAAQARVPLPDKGPTPEPAPAQDPGKE